MNKLADGSRALPMAIAIIFISSSVAENPPWYFAIFLYVVALLNIAYALRD